MNKVENELKNEIYKMIKQDSKASKYRENLINVFGLTSKTELNDKLNEQAEAMVLAAKTGKLEPEQLADAIMSDDRSTLVRLVSVMDLIYRLKRVRELNGKYTCAKITDVAIWRNITALVISAFAKPKTQDDKAKLLNLYHLAGYTVESYELLVGVNFENMQEELNEHAATTDMLIRRFL